MRVSHLFATLVALVTGLALVWTISAYAQGPAANQGVAQPQNNRAAAAERNGTSVAVIDIKYIFDNHPGFKRTMDSIKAEYEAFEAKVRETESVLRKKIEELKAMTPGSPEFKKLEEEIAQSRTTVQLDIGRRQKQRVEDEAKVYYHAYQDIEKEIIRCCDLYGFELVLQFSSAEIDPSKPDTVIRGLNRLVVHQRGRNITNHILEQLNRGAPPANTGVVRPSTTKSGQAQRPSVVPNTSGKKY